MPSTRSKHFAQRVHEEEGHEDCPICSDRTKRLREALAEAFGILDGCAGELARNHDLPLWVAKRFSPVYDRLRDGADRAADALEVSDD